MVLVEVQISICSLTLERNSKTVLLQTHTHKPHSIILAQ